ncbi:MZB1 protein, partial [Atractosteus spatula]|nr:MZB1 protein [Atractosteus spatula]
MKHSILSPPGSLGSCAHGEGVLLTKVTASIDEVEKHAELKEQTSAEQTIRFTSPELTAEDKNSGHMPDYLRCDACKAIAFQMTEYLAKAQQGKNADLLESEYMDALEQSCFQKWEQYGLKEVYGVKHLSGPGLETESEMGMVMFGGPWPGRLFKMCQNYLGEYDETEIYQEYRRNPSSLRDYLCFGSSGVCNRLSKKEKIYSPKNEL